MFKRIAKALLLTALLSSVIATGLLVAQDKKPACSNTPNTGCQDNNYSGVGDNVGCADTGGGCACY